MKDSRSAVSVGFRKGRVVEVFMVVRFAAAMVGGWRRRRGGFRDKILEDERRGRKTEEFPQNCELCSRSQCPREKYLEYLEPLYC
ncbi:hypothetical protein BJX70DRAFT_365410, partial [Aspergillus crustosus]